ncbi:MAG: sigma 54-interacting transcriptional regulator [Deltaproteobacteria bacterium]|nr:sigma 54-interacting transcriptional regulator [Deltaproteobacteria bacterium]
MPTLRVTSPGQPPKVYHLYKKVTSVGRSEDCDVVVQDPDVGGSHCHIHFDGRIFNLAPIGDHRIFVNGKRQKKHELAHQDVVRLGETDLVFSVYEEPVEASEATSTAVDVSPYRMLFDFSGRLLRKYELGELLEALMDAVIAVTNADKGFLVLLENNEPRIRVARNVRSENIDDAVDQLSDSIVAKVVRTRQPLIVSDALKDDEFANSMSIMKLNVVSVMCVPLMDKESLIGLIYVGNDNVIQLFEQQALEVLTIFAAQASLIVKNALLINELRDDKRHLSERLEAIRFGRIIGSCDAMRDVFKKLEKVATTDISVLITGETGTGKELIASEIHERSSRAKGPFVTINCGAIPENLLESELFGHVKGAFTGAVAHKRGKFHAADGGTLFLDEIGELPMQLQVKILRAIQEKTVVRVGETRPEPVNIRILAATNKELEAEIRNGRFREDLYYRLNVVNLHLPPLRERGEDLTVIAKYLLQKFAEEYSSKVRGFSPNAMIAIRKHPWPGNIRQLENHIKKAVVLADKPLLSPEDLDLSAEELPPILPLVQATEDFKRRYINEVLARNNDNRTKTAKDLGVDPRTIFRHLEREDELKGRP